MRFLTIFLLAFVFSKEKVQNQKKSAHPNKNAEVKQDPLMFGVMTQDCYNKLVVEKQLDVPCAKKTVAKLLGLAIVVGAPLAKIP